MPYPEPTVAHSDGGPGWGGAASSDANRLLLLCFVKQGNVSDSMSDEVQVVSTRLFQTAEPSLLAGKASSVSLQVDFQYICFPECFCSSKLLDFSRF